MLIINTFDSACWHITYGISKKQIWWHIFIWTTCGKFVFTSQKELLWFISYHKNYPHLFSKKPLQQAPLLLLSFAVILVVVPFILPQNKAASPLLHLSNIWLNVSSSNTSLFSIWPNPTSFFFQFTVFISPGHIFHNLYYAGLIFVYCPGSPSECYLS